MKKQRIRKWCLSEWHWAGIGLIVELAAATIGGERGAHR